MSNSCCCNHTCYPSLGVLEQLRCKRNLLNPGNVRCELMHRYAGTLPGGDPAFSVSAPYSYYHRYGYEGFTNEQPKTKSQIIIVHYNPYNYVATSKIYER